MCALFGIIDNKGSISLPLKINLLKSLAKSAEARGTNAAGIAFNTHKKIDIQKAGKPAHRINFNIKWNPAVIMGHTRFTTQGTEKNNYNNHPFSGKNGSFALAHNGVLYNDKELRMSENLPDSKIETDSYVAVQLIDKYKTADVNFDCLRTMAEKIEGSFCITVLDRENNLYIIKGDNPLVIADFGKFKVYASTGNILKKAVDASGLGKIHCRIMEPEAGEIWKLGRAGIEKDYFDMYSDYYTDYSYYNSYWNLRDTGYKNYYSAAERKTLKEQEQDYLDNILDYASILGISEEEIYCLLDEGFTLDEICDYLYATENSQYIEETKTE